MRKTILITAGGTGGHIFPALAIANSLIQDNYEVMWVGSKNGIENNIVKNDDINFYGITISGLRKNGLRRMLLMPFLLLRSCFQVLLIILKTRPDIIVGFGGYVTFPVCLVGFILRLPIVIHEQNSVAGLSNKLLAKISDRALLAFPNALSSKNSFIVGNPVREEILSITPYKERYLSRNGGLNILVLGGSLGASAFNKLLPQVFAKVNQIKPNYLNTITHQVGRGDELAVKETYTNLGMTNVKVVKFIEDMAAAYSMADLVICRSGASTVSEICVVGLAAIFIPYPYAVDNHQFYNVKPLIDKNAAKLILQSQLSIDTMSELIANLSRDDCLELATNINNFAIPDSVLRIRNNIIDCIEAS